ncbi:MAG TPA: hypothetical protein DET40_01050 [Lentisphaeria bacterium]|nr:MAG: hypothetical protein A2X45_25095 [Lentisphaerae bacterium GWF2_50_93]HCE42119.1 hypothetical protein [Lentisphaeria bacterium]
MNNLKYQKTVDQIKGLILSGHLKAGDILPPERVLCEKNNISRITVRKAFDMLEQEGVIKREQGRGTFIAETPVEDKAVRSVVALAFKSFGMDVKKNFFIMGLFNELKGIFESRGTTVSMIQIPEEETFYSYLRKYSIPENSFVSGVIFTMYSPEKIEIKNLEEAKIPCVLIGETDIGSIPTVKADHVGEGYMVVKHLMEQGHRKIALIDGPRGYSFVEERLEGYKKAFKDHRIPFSMDNYFETTGWKKEDGIKAAGQLLKSGGKFDGIVSFGDRSTIGVIESLKRNNVNVPEDMPVVMADKYQFMDDMMSFRITGTIVSLEGMACKAVELLDLKKKGGLILENPSVVPVVLDKGES